MSDPNLTGAHGARSSSSRMRGLPAALLAAAVLLIGGIAACSEQPTGSLGCPTLCSDQSATLRDTILNGAVVIDTTFLGFPRLGEDPNVVLQNRGDTADVRMIARYDSLPRVYRIATATADSTIRRVDSATMIMLVDTLVTKPTVPVTIDAFDVDTTANDTIPATLLPLFRAGRLIGSQVFNPADFKDTLRLKLSDSAVFAKVRDSLHLRIGLRIRGVSNAQLRIASGTFSPRVRFRVSADTTIKPDTSFPLSRTPADPNIQNALTVYPLIAAGALPLPPTGLLAVGGLAGARSYLRFDIPPIVLDSVQVIRASLELEQRPARGTARVADTLSLYVQPVLASPLVTDLYTASTFIGSATAYGVDTLRFSARDSASRSIELVNLVRFWRAVGTTNTTRSLVLRSPQERRNPGELDFVSTEGSVTRRPRLRLTYVPRRGFGIP